MPWVTFFEGEIAATQAYYQIIGQDYLGSTNARAGYSLRDPFNPFRDAINNAVGVRQYFLLGAADRYMSIGYQWDDNDPTSSDGTDFAYTDNMFDVRVDFGMFDWAHGTVGYLFDLQDYEHPNSRTDFSKRRHDSQNQIVIRVREGLPAVAVGGSRLLRRHQQLEHSRLRVRPEHRASRGAAAPLRSQLTA